MTPWITDANDLQPKEVARFKSNLLHPTRRVEAFLQVENREATIVVAPKGFGKTLLLMAKRLSIQGNFSKILPTGQALVDKPSGTPSVVSSSEYGQIREDVSYWKNVWLVALSIVIAKVQCESISDLSDPSKKIFDDPDALSMCDIFDKILSSSRDDYFKFIFDYNSHIVPKIRLIENQIALFIDNIDEHFGESYSASFARNSGQFGDLSDDYWYLAQLGLALASREINRINKHIKIFISIRKEVIQKSVHMGSFWTQLKGKCIEIEYTNRDIVEIVNKNIEMEPKRNLKDPGASEPIDRFVGSDLNIVHPITGDEELFLDFWIRHTLQRPRDVIAIGREISFIRADERSPERLSACVREEGANLVRAYMYEMQPHLPGFDPDLICRLIPSNTLDRRDLSGVSDNYAKLYQEKYGVIERHTEHVFCAMFKIGILGYISFDVGSGKYKQIFRKIGENSLDELGILPEADHYVVHPSLDSLIGRARPKYFENMNKYNIIGWDKSWRQERSISYILKGDVKGYSEIMKDTAQATAFGSLFERALCEAGSNLDYAKVSAGDSVLLIDRNPVSLISAAREISMRILNSEFRKQMRYGGHAGFVSITAENGVKVPQGYAIRAAARLEEVGIPGKILVSNRFVSELSDQFDSPVYAFRELDAGDLPEVEFKDGEFNVMKSSGYDDATWMKVFEVFRD